MKSPVRRALKPAFRHRVRALVPPARFRVVTQPLQDAGVAGDADHSLGGQVDVARQMTGEVVRAKLLARILAELVQIAHPLAQGFGVLAKQIVLRAEGNGGFQHHEHVAAFLDGHLITGIVHLHAGGIEIVGSGVLPLRM